MTRQRDIALPQVKSMLGEAAGNQVAREAAREGAGVRRRRISTMPLRTRAFAALGVVSVAAVGAVGAGALNRAPVAPELSPAQSGVKPDVIPGESKTVQTPSGTVEESISPCIKSDPTGYTDAELENTEWCFHAPGQGASAAKANAGSQSHGQIESRTINGATEYMYGKRK